MTQTWPEHEPVSQDQWLNAVSTPYTECYYCDAKKDFYHLIKRTNVHQLENSGIYSAAVHLMADAIVSEENYDEIRRKLSIPYIRSHLTKERPSYILSYKTNEENDSRWCRVRVVMIDTDENDEVWHFAVNFAEDSGEKQLGEILYHICNKVMLVNMTTNQFLYIKDGDHDVVLEKYQTRKATEICQSFVKDEVVCPEDKEALSTFISLEHLIREMDRGVDYMQTTYRHKMDHGYEWRMVEIWKSDRYLPSDKQIIITEKGISKDVRQMLKRAADDLKKAEQIRTNYLDYFSKSLRAPMKAIASFGSQIREACQNKNSEKMEELLTQLERMENFMSAQLDNMDTICRMKTIVPDISFERRPVFVKQLFSDFQIYMDTQLSGRQIQFSILCDVNARKKYYADVNAFEEMVFAFLDNAIQYTPDGGKIELTFRKVQENIEGWKIQKYRQLEKNSDLSDSAWKDQKVIGDRLEICIRDWGIGMEESELEKIFDPFYKIQDGRMCEREFEGIGLGLAVAKSIMDAVGGEIRVESEPGRGSSFYLTFFFGYDPQDTQRIVSDED